ncbi:DeoR family transcriptional regulator [Patescibacteria group bacterium]|nr:DeoR family transcriptional regulator [Patescibacteria group bacterium]
MNKEYIIQLTSQLYKLTLLFPKKEPLRYKMRELADEILADMVSIFVSDWEFDLEKVVKDLEILDSYFEVAKDQSWVSPSDVLSFQQEYSNIKEEVKKRAFGIQSSGVEAFEDEQEELADDNSPLIQIEQEEAAENSSPLVQEEEGVSGRQEKIIGILKQKGKAQVWEFKEIFPELSKRTIRRDFEQLLNKGIVEREGEHNLIFYRLKG